MTDKMREQCERLRELISQYWDIAWREGNDGRRHDTEEGSAQECINEIEGVLSQLQAAQRQGGEAVAWMNPHDGEVVSSAEKHSMETHNGVPGQRVAQRYFQPLYTAPQPAVPEGNAELRAAFSRTAVSLLAAITLLEDGGREAAPSDLMFNQMLLDYKESLRSAREILTGQRLEPPEDV